VHFNPPVPCGTKELIKAPDVPSNRSTRLLPRGCLHTGFPPDRISEHALDRPRLDASSLHCSAKTAVVAFLADGKNK
jgi:hypothetical protein